MVMQFEKSQQRALPLALQGGSQQNRLVLGRSSADEDEIMLTPNEDEVEDATAQGATGPNGDDIVYNNDNDNGSVYELL